MRARRNAWSWRSVSLAATCIVALVFGASGVIAAPNSACVDFTVAAIPDTQNYTDYSHQKKGGYPYDAVNLLFEQMQYIADHAQSAGGDIAFATALGDVWQHATESITQEHLAQGFRQVPNPISDIRNLIEPDEVPAVEIPNAVKSYRIIAGKLPFSVVPGNHDLDSGSWAAKASPRADLSNKANKPVYLTGGLNNFLSAFSDRSEFFRDQPWYVASHDGGADSAQVFTVGKCRFLHIGLQWDAPDASLAWADAVIKQFPGMPTIVSTHQFLNTKNDRVADAATVAGNNSAQTIWEKFISQHDQIFMVLCGHLYAQGYRVDQNHFGHEVYQILSDYQERWQIAKDADLPKPRFGFGDGWLRLMKFHLDSDHPSVQIRTYSTFYRKFSTEMENYASAYKAYEKPTLSDADFLKQDEFLIDLTDFHKRFPDLGH